MDKNTLIGALLIGAVLIGFTWLSKPDPTQSPAPSPQDTTQLVTQAPAPAAGATVADSASLDSLGAPVLPPYLQPAQERIVELKNEKLSVKLSTKGGAPVKPSSLITSISLRSPSISSAREMLVLTCPYVL